MHEPRKWYDANATDNPAWIKALAEVRSMAPREGWCSSMCRRSLSASTNTPRQRSAIGIIF
jgi:hypothetical protein